MKEIKTRQTIKDIRVLDRAANVTDRIKNAYVYTKEQAEQTQHTNADSSTGYAENENRVTESAQDVTREVGYELRHQGKRLVEKAWQKIKERHIQGSITEPEKSKTKGEAHNVQQKAATSKALASSHELHVSESNPYDYATHGRVFARDSVRRHTEPNGSDYTGKETKHGVKTVERGMKQSTRVSRQTVKKGARGSVKTAERSIKTAEKSSRAAIKTTQTTAKTAAKTAKATARTAQRVAQAARATAKAAATAIKTIAKAIAATVKALITTAKGFVSAIASGGWVAVVVIIVVLLAAYILCSVFGLFASEEGYDGAPSMPEVVSQINNAGSASMVTN